jgi:hypothetical protein
MKKVIVLLTQCLLLTVGVSAGAQSFAINWFTIDGGGGTSTGSVYSISGTIGQPDAGAMSGGSYRLEGGFWNATVTVQTEGAPLLTITRAGGSVVLSWPSSSTGFVLQENSSLATSNWSNVVSVPNDDGTNKSVTISMALGNRFYRLRK